MTKLGIDTNPVGMHGWAIEANPPNAGAEHPSTVRLVCTSSGKTRLTAAGIVAVLGQISTYLTSAKVAAIIARSQTQTCHIYVDRGQAYMTVLPEDGPAQITALAALFQTAANVTTA